jgi:hypothetical protein
MTDVRNRGHAQRRRVSLLRLAAFNLVRETAHRMILGVGVCGVGGNNVADPAERAARANPKARRDDKPKNSREDAAVVKLSYAGNDKTQKSCGKWIAHNSCPPLVNCEIPYDDARKFVRSFERAKV